MSVLHWGKQRSGAPALWPTCGSKGFISVFQKTDVCHGWSKVDPFNSGSRKLPGGLMEPGESPCVGKHQAAGAIQDFACIHRVHLEGPIRAGSERTS